MNATRRLLALCAIFIACTAYVPRQDLKAALKIDLVNYLASRARAEHISAASLTVSLANGKWLDVAAGSTAYGGGGAAVTPASLFQIGSNTKAFTSVIMLHLQRAKKLGIHRPIGQWLPQYPQWQNVTIARLLDMTSGIETYDNTNAWSAAYVKDPYHNFTPQELIAYVTSVPLMHGWHYSNTGYQLCDLIAEKVSGRAYVDLMRELIASAGLQHTYYYTGIYPQDLRDRTVAGYYDVTNAQEADGLAPIAGRNVRDDSLSWTQAAGGIVATPHDMAKWARDLYQGNVVTAGERKELETLVAQATGKPLADVTAETPGGFGLGVARVYKPGLGAFWFYEGETLGYRMVHAYFPKQNLVIAVGLNSQPNKPDDHVGALIQSIVATLKQYGAI